jgi:hypothetical protein
MGQSGHARSRGNICNYSWWHCRCKRLMTTVSYVVYCIWSVFFSLLFYSKWCCSLHIGGSSSIAIKYIFERKTQKRREEYQLLCRNQMVVRMRHTWPLSHRTISQLVFTN